MATIDAPSVMPRMSWDTSWLILQPFRSPILCLVRVRPVSVEVCHCEKIDTGEGWDVFEVVDRYRSDAAMLDGLWLWAANPSIQKHVGLAAVMTILVITSPPDMGLPELV